MIKDEGMKACMSIKPNTKVEELFPYADKLDMVLIMTVEPGFGGQKFMHECVTKIEVLRKKYANLDIEVDGGINLENIDVVTKAGANVIVAGSSIFKSHDPKSVIHSFFDSVNKHI